MSRRKIILLSACGALLCIYILQLVFSLRNPVKEIKLEKSFDAVTIQTASGKIQLARSGENWVIGEQKYQANKSLADAIESAVKSISVLNTVGHTGNEAAEGRYDLTADKAITVTASAAGKTVRTLVIGKAASTGSQTYVTIDGSKDICLVSGNLHDTFGKTAGDLRSKLVYTLDKDALTGIAETANGATLTLAKSGNPASWNAANGTPAVDPEKAGSWAESLYSVSVNSWLDDSFALPGDPVSVTVITAGTKKVTLTIYKTGKDNDAKYYGTCSETPYKFELSSYAAGKYMKKAEELKK